MFLPLFLLFLTSMCSCCSSRCPLALPIKVRAHTGRCCCRGYGVALCVYLELVVFARFVVRSRRRRALPRFLPLGRGGARFLGASRHGLGELCTAHLFFVLQTGECNVIVFDLLAQFREHRLEVLLPSVIVVVLCKLLLRLSQTLLESGDVPGLFGNLRILGLDRFVVLVLEPLRDGLSLSQELLLPLQSLLGLLGKVLKILHVSHKLLVFELERMHALLQLRQGLRLFVAIGHERCNAVRQVLGGLSSLRPLLGKRSCELRLSR
mmetsp:Transcript_17255/g.41135  ORF Transcript_17255/g.41135 Transcript_17255/m.41135 type:complete len:265 (-) Transcript_17255:338-1132(-)